MEDYFKIKALSASQLKHFIPPGSIVDFWQNCVFNPNQIEYLPSAAAEFGSLCHSMLLEPNLLDHDIAIWDPVDPKEEFVSRVLDGKLTKKYVNACEKNPGKRVVTKKEFDHAQLMIAALKNNCDVVGWLKGMTFEHEILIKSHPGMIYDTAFGTVSLPAKCKIDGVDLAQLEANQKLPENQRKTIKMVDYKTTCDINKVRDFSHTMGWHIQDAFYKKMVRLEHGECDIKFVFITQCSKPGKQHLIEIFEFDNMETMAWVDEKVEESMAMIAYKLAEFKQNNNLDVWQKPFRTDEPTSLDLTNSYMERVDKALSLFT